MIAFFCATQFHILTSISIKYSLMKNTPSDIYILNHINGNEKIANNLREIGLFDNVILVDNVKFNNSLPNSKSKILRTLKYSVLYSSYKKVAREYFGIKKSKYTKVYVGVFDIILKMAIRQLLTDNKKLEINVFEDGTGSYKTENFNVKGRAKYLFDILGYDKVSNYANLFLSQPELYPGTIDVPIYKIPTLNLEDNKLKIILNRTFNYKSEYKIKEKIVYFEQPFNEIQSKLDVKMKDIITPFLKDDYIIKIHPRSSDVLYRDFNIYQEKIIPWEIIDLNSCSDEKILISYCSTTCFTSKLIYNKEPYIVLLYNLEELGNKIYLKKEILDFIKRFISCYSIPDKICIPNNLNELKEFLENTSR